MIEKIKQIIIRYLEWRKERLSTIVTLPTSGTTTITKEMENAIHRIIREDKGEYRMKEEKLAEIMESLRHHLTLAQSQKKVVAEHFKQYARSILPQKIKNPVGTGEAAWNDAIRLAEKNIEKGGS